MGRQKFGWIDKWRRILKKGKLKKELVAKKVSSKRQSVET